MDRLRERLSTSTSSSMDDNQLPTQSKQKKPNANKQTHRVDLGWYHYDNSKRMYVQVREKNGGGKRTVLLNKDMDKKAIIKQCTDLFFPDGHSQHGELKDMDVELTDFQLKPLPDEDTKIGDIVDKAKLQKLRFYLNTRTDSNKDPKSPTANPPNQVIQRDDNQQHINSTIIQTCCVARTATNSTGQSFANNQLLETSNSRNIRSDNKTPEKGKAPAKGNADDPLLTRNLSEIDSSPLPDPFPDLDEATSSVWEDSFGEVIFTRTSPLSITTAEVHEREPEDIKILVHRGHVFKELINFFKSTHGIRFETDKITAHIILPNGDMEQAFDDGGVMRDLLTEFWDDFYAQCTKGSTLKVPYLRHDFEATDWKAVARVLAMGWSLQKILPIRLAPSFLSSCLYGLAAETLTEEFLQYVTPTEGKIITDAMEKLENVDQDDLMEILSTYECKVRITKQNISTVIDQIANKELVQEPAFIRECFFEVLITYELSINVKAEFSKIAPTSKKLLSILDCTEPDAESFKYLKRFIREIDEDTKLLRTLLRFLTGSDLMLYDSEGSFHRISTRLVDLAGVARRPIAHTCGRSLELPRSYESYPIFKFELNSILNSQVWVMDIA